VSDLERIPDWMQPDTTPPLAGVDLRAWAAEFRDVYTVAEALCKTPFVPQAMYGKPADVAGAIMKGRELGLDPLDALGCVYVVHGRVGYYAEFLRRRIIQAGHSLRIVESTDSRAVIEATRKGENEPKRASFTAEQARRAGIDLGKYPADKLIARATSRLCRQVFPDVLSGSLIVEDLEDLERILCVMERDYGAEFRSGFIAENPAKLRRIHRYFSAVCGRGSYPPVRCNVTDFSAVIGADGQVNPCFFIPGPRASHAGDDLGAVLNTESMLRLRESITQGARPECARCVCSMWRAPESRGAGNFLLRNPSAGTTSGSASPAT